MGGVTATSMSAIKQISPPPPGNILLLILPLLLELVEESRVSFLTDKEMRMLRPPQKGLLSK